MDTGIGQRNYTASREIILALIDPQLDPKQFQERPDPKRDASCVYDARGYEGRVPLEPFDTARIKTYHAKKVIATYRFIPPFSRARMTF